MSHGKSSGRIVDATGRPPFYPTHLHSAEFWEHLGRAIATFGFLEEVLGKAIFVLTSERQIAQDEISAELKKWQSELEHALADPLGGLIPRYEAALMEAYGKTAEQHGDLLKELRRLKDYRDVLCHASWSRAPDANGRCTPLFVRSKDKLVFDTAIDVGFLVQVQTHTAQIVCAVVSTIAASGRQFPGISESKGQ